VTGDDSILIELALIAVLLLLNGFFAGAEIAVVTARRGRVQGRADEGDRRARALLRLKADPDRFLATVQIGVTVVGTLAATVGGVAAVERLEPFLAGLPVPLARELAEPVAVGAVVSVIAFLSLVVGELVPKSLAVRHAETLALLVARPIEWLARLARWPVAILTAATRFVLKLFGQRVEVQSPFHTLEDLRTMVEEAEKQGLLEGQVVRGAFAIQDCAVRAIMTPRQRVVGIPREASLDEALRTATESGYSRFPVYRGDLDHPEGLLYARDLFEARLRGATGSVAPLVQSALVVPGTKTARALLAEMRRDRLHMALVVDEYGAVVGLVTLEDVLEIIVGEIEDERDVAEEPVRVLGEGVFELDGAVSIAEANARLGVSLPESPDYVSVAGLVLHRLGSLPQGGETVELPPYRLEVAAVEGRRIARVRIATATTAPP